MGCTADFKEGAALSESAREKERAQLNIELQKVRLKLAQEQQKTVGRGHPRFYALLDEMRQLHDRKNSDYADTAQTGDPLLNFREAQGLGVTPFNGVLVRMSDKWARVKTLVKKRSRGEGAAVKDESLTDTLLDLANYALLGIVLLEEE